ncbi:protein-disulfide isomerase [Labrys sp. WJW]|uniref:DsbA family protein n=1 Tax=Labrys sp. WJW TaxID=1737983 RepID=UPI00082F120C|nr:protein-disulfide isomerase [Labrys sp. WJW]OCC02664.1 protein-disulfide isomerase [Labrys sp. WJW]
MSMPLSSDEAARGQAVTYLFDPLCGWCYGAAPMLQRLRAAGVAVSPVPTGLFTGPGARPMDAGFAAYAWSNDQRIERLTGQHFTEAYRNQVLDAEDGLFDSGPATLALTAVVLAEPERELDALAAIQAGRYVEGRDTTSLACLVAILRDAGFIAAADRLATPDEALLAANRARIVEGRALMASLGAQGVPALVAQRYGQQRLIASNALFGSFDNLVSHLNA